MQLSGGGGGGGGGYRNKVVFQTVSKLLLLTLKLHLNSLSSLVSVMPGKKVTVHFFAQECLPS